MSATVTLGVMLQRLHGMEDTKDFSDWENEFVKKMWRITLGGTRTSVLTGNQAEKVEDLFKRHFAA